jgi:hypothetical protein
LFISNTATVSERWGIDDRARYQHFSVDYLGVGPGDLVARDIIVAFSKVGNALSFRPKKGRLGDGYFKALRAQIIGSEITHYHSEEIVLV